MFLFLSYFHEMISELLKFINVHHVVLWWFFLQYGRGNWFTNNYTIQGHRLVYQRFCVTLRSLPPFLQKEFGSFSIHCYIDTIEYDTPLLQLISRLVICYSYYLVCFTFLTKTLAWP